MYEEDDLLPLSALQHLIFCERRAALVHIEQLWDENRFTAEGRQVHDRAHEPETESRGDVRFARGLLLRSLRLGLSGKADLVEFRRVGSADPPGSAVALPGVRGLWRPFPVEYKRGRQRSEEGYEIQLCAQALCLEEMMQTAIPAGALLYRKSQRRVQVQFDSALRSKTEDAAARLHELLRSAHTPPPLYGKKCEKCSLLDLCLPKAATPKHSAKSYLARALADIEEDGL